MSTAVGDNNLAAAPPTPVDTTDMARASDGLLASSRDLPVGGQAVLEGVMMRGVKHWALAVRKPAPESEDGSEALGEIDVQEFQLTPPKRPWLLKVPLLRGVVALWGSLAIGMRALTLSANAQMPEAEEGEEQIELSGGVWAGTMLIAAIFAIGIFFIVPLTLTNLVKHQLNSSVLFWLVEGVIRIAIFLAYMWLIARARDMRRTFEYHGAEHKVISCYEAGDALTPERAALYSRFHPRCGTSFLLVVMLVSILIFAFTGVHAWWVLVTTRLIGIPVVIGVSFEIIKWAGKNRRFRAVQWIIWPGMQLQRLTTREPDLTQLAVAIASLNAVLKHETPGDLTAEDLLGVEVVA
jgi:uncharacterized protein YqhQ